MYVLVSIVKKELKIDLSLNTILQILSVSLFEKIPILQAFTFTDYNKLYVGNPNQLNLFD